MKKGWPQITLGELTAHRPICYGVLKPGERQISGVPLIRITDITDNELDESDIYHITPALSAEFRRSVLQGGEVLLSIQGTIGRVAICPEHLKGANISRTIALISPDNRIARPFLRYWLLSLDGDFPICGSTRASLNIGALRELKAPVPPLAEQRRIVGVLDEAFAGLATAQAHAAQNLQNARALFESHLQSVFTHRGKGWVEKPLKELTERITKGSSPKWQGIAYVEKPGVLFVTSENVGLNEILLDYPKYVEEKFNQKDRKSILRCGDVLTNIVGASIGRTAVFDRDDAANINQAVCLIRCLPDLLLNRFLAYFLNSPVLRDVLHAGEVNMARANLSLGFFSELPVACPTLAEQIAVVEHLDALAAETQRLTRLYEQKRAALAALKKSLLHQAFTGAL